MPSLIISRLRSIRTRLRSLRRTTWIVLGVFSFLHLPLVLPIFGPERGYSFIAGDLPLLCVALTMIVFAICRRRAAGHERTFWNVLIAGHAAFAAGSLVYYVPNFAGRDLINDGFYLAYYFALSVAAGLSPNHTPRKLRDLERQMRLRRAGAVLLIFAGLAYFLLVPLYWNPAEYYTWLPSFYLYAVCDFVLAVLFLRSGWLSSTPRWRRIYGLLGIANVLWWMVEMISCLLFAGWIQWNWVGPQNFVWSLPFLPLFALLEVSPSTRREKSRRPSYEISRFSPLILCAFIVPGVHLCADRLGVFNESTRAPRDWIVLITLAALLSLAMIEGFLISRRQARLEETERQLHQAQKMDAVGQLASGLVHDLRNLMMLIQWHAGLARGGVEPESSTALDLEQIEKAVGATEEMLTKLRDVTRRKAVDKEAIDLHAVILDQANMLRGLLGKNVVLEVDAAEDLSPIDADLVQLDQVVMNLCLNARDALSEEGGTIRLSARQIYVDEAIGRLHPWAKPGEYVQMEVADDGSGMDEETLEHVFEPFFTTKGEHGSGLGLASVYAIVRAHRGLIDVESSPGEGTRFRISWPSAN